MATEGMGKRKLNKKEVRQAARSFIIDLIISEVNNPSEMMTWEDFPELGEYSFEESYKDVYEEMRRICNSLADRWKI